MASVWTHSIEGERSAYPPLEGELKTDVLVVGGGMAGVLCARLLHNAGLRCVLAEARRIGEGVTANTTAKITAQHGAVYAKLIRNHGADIARGYYEAQEMAAKALREMAATVPCELEEKTAYLYTSSEHHLLEEEAKAYGRLGVPHVQRQAVSLPGGPVMALGMQGSAQFNPLRFLLGTAEGLEIYENTFIREIRGNRAISDMGSITARYIILATHYPLVNIPGLYFIKLKQQRSYVLALADAPDVGGMYIGLDGGKHSFRNYGQLLLVGGGNHTTGTPGGQYKALRGFVRGALPEAKERYAWATQDCISLDSMPYIGQHRHGAAGLLVATGFNKWGMTGAMLAAMLLRDEIQQRQGAYAGLFAPTRHMPSGAVGTRAGESIKGYLHLGKRCSHMGCALHWNEAEASWDCPCHGSRFSQTGEVLDNPAKRGIQP